MIVYGNTAPEGPNIFWEDFDSGPPSVETSIVGGGYQWGIDILDDDPMFVRTPDPGPDMTWGTTDDDYGDLRLRTGSVGVDYGFQSFLPPDIWDLDDDGDTTEFLPIDLKGDPRVQMAEVDLGAYEGPVSVSNEPQAAPQTEQRLRVYPNPATDYITIETEVEEVEILDVLGRVVLRTKSAERIDVSALPMGVYYIKIGRQSRRFTVVR